MLLKRTEQGCMLTLLKHVRSMKLPPMLPVAGIRGVRARPRVRSGPVCQCTPSRARAGSRLCKARRIQVTHRLLGSCDAKGRTNVSLKRREESRRNRRVTLRERF